MTNDLLYADPDLARFYDWDNPWPKAFDFFLSLAEGAHRVLDLGCGTGIFSTALAARGHAVTGADPAEAMLTHARFRPGGDQVRWVHADARSIDLGETFDMVLMTGHAFQTLLTKADRAAAIAAIARHLTPGGRFFFDSRQPGNEAWRRWTPEATREVNPHPEFGTVERWNDASCDAETGIVTYGTYYRIPGGQLFSARSCIAAATQSEIADLLTDAGLTVDHWLGDAKGNAFSAASPDIIPVGHKVG